MIYFFFSKQQSLEISNMRSSNLILIINILVAFVFLFGCTLPVMGLGEVYPPPPQYVNIINSSFVPDNITVSLNTTVVWSNHDNTEETVTAVDGSFDSGNITPNGFEYRYIFLQSGWYEYYSSDHPSMRGKVIVMNADGSIPSEPPQLAPKTPATPTQKANATTNATGTTNATKMNATTNATGTTNATKMNATTNATSTTNATKMNATTNTTGTTNATKMNVTTNATGVAATSQANVSQAQPAAATGAGAVPPIMVEINRFLYNPDNITVTVGTTIVWVNYDRVTHTVTANDGSFDSGNIIPGQKFSNTFTKVGSFNYHDKAYPYMRGTVRVIYYTGLPGTTATSAAPPATSLAVPPVNASAASSPPSQNASANASSATTLKSNVTANTTTTNSSIAPKANTSANATKVSAAPAANVTANITGAMNATRMNTTTNVAKA
jgi:plastocyanin